eukprot:tig00020629_g12350.t1
MAARLNCAALIARVRACKPYKVVATGEWEVPLEPFVLLLQELANACNSIGELLKGPANNVMFKAGLLANIMRSKNAAAMAVEVVEGSQQSAPGNDWICSCLPFLSGAADAAPSPFSSTRKIVTVQSMIRDEIRRRVSTEARSGTRAAIFGRYVLELVVIFVRVLMDDAKSLREGASIAYQSTLGRRETGVVRGAVDMAINGLPEKGDFYRRNGLTNESAKDQFRSFADEAAPVARSVITFSKQNRLEEY